MAKVKQIHKGTEDQRRWTIIEISRRRDAQYLPQLLARLNSDETYENRRHIVRALGNIGDPSSIEPLKTILETESGDILGDAAHSLGELHAMAAEPLIEKLVEHSRPWVAQQARWALKQLRSK